MGWCGKGRIEHSCEKVRGNQSLTIGSTRYGEQEWWIQVSHGARFSVECGVIPKNINTFP
jgi:hypothetical protein